MKIRTKLFPLIFTLAILPLAGCFHHPYDPAAILIGRKPNLQRMAQNVRPHLDAAGQEALDKTIQLSLQDPAKASTLIGDLPATDVKTLNSFMRYELDDNTMAKAVGIMAVAQSWYAKDPHAATAWLNTLPPGEPRNYGVEAILLDAVSRDPATALDLANIMSLGYHKIAYLQGVVALWAKTDPAAAKAAVQSAKFMDIIAYEATAEQLRKILLGTIEMASTPAKN